MAKEELDKMASEKNFCEKNRHGSYDCTLCKVIMSTTELYNKHCETAVHTLNL